jgi:hypothetical protein
MDTTTSSPRRVSRWVLAGLVAVLAVAVVAAGLLIANDGGNSNAASNTSTQIASVRAACQNWLDSDQTQPGSAGWCNGMADWMTQRMGQAMGPQMMWGDPERMRATCQQWMTSNPPAGATVDAQSWCDSMVAWMSDRIGDWNGSGDWDDWMMNSTRGR